MKYLGINTAGSTLELLVNVDGKINYRNINGKACTGEVLLNEIDILLDECKIAVKELDFVACVIGPGSFTGIRIGVNTARAFGYATGVRVLGITYLERAAYIAKEACTVVLDGSNGTCYVQSFDNTLQESTEPKCVRIENVCDIQGKIVADAGVAQHLGVVPFETEAHSFACAIESNAHKAKNFAAIEPLYIRKSQAERGEGDL